MDTEHKLKTPKTRHDSELNVVEFYVPIDVSSSRVSSETSVPFSDAQRRDLNLLYGMASHGGEDGTPPELEPTRPAAVDLAASLSSLLADAPAGGDGCGSLEEAGHGDSRPWRW